MTCIELANKVATVLFYADCSPASTEVIRIWLFKLNQPGALFVLSKAIVMIDKN